MPPEVLMMFGSIVALLGVAASLPFVGVLMFKMDINANMFAAVVTKLIVAGNIERAQKLCRAAPNSYCVVGVAAMLEAWEGGERSRNGLSRAFASAVSPKKKALSLFRLVSLFGFVLGAAALGLHFAFRVPPPTWTWVMSGAAVFAALHVAWKVKTIPEQAATARDAILAGFSKQPGFTEAEQGASAWKWD